MSTVTQFPRQKPDTPTDHVRRDAYPAEIIEKHSEMACYLDEITEKLDSLRDAITQLHFARLALEYQQEIRPGEVMSVEQLKALTRLLSKTEIDLEFNSDEIDKLHQYLKKRVLSKPVEKEPK